MSPKEMESKSIGSAGSQTTRNGRRLFGTNGIRGVVNRDFTPEFVTKVAGAIGTFFRKGQILVGCDGRTSSQMFFRALVGGLLSTGCTVYNVGMAPTPAVQYAVKHYKMDGGIIITASHNPPEYNGIKVVASDGIELPREKESKIEKIFWDEKSIRTEWDAIGKTSTLPGILDLYIEAIKTHVDTAAIKQRRCHVVVDPGNGVGTLTAPYLLHQIGCQVTTINANVDGTFPSRLSEPRPENLEELASTVKAVEADVGVAYDGDADRAIFVDETGEIHWGDRTFALIEKHFLQNNPNKTIVTPVSSSRLIKDIADKYGGKVVWTKVGSVIVSHAMQKEKAKLGGEENGGVFYGPHQPVRDGTMTTALILDIMAKTNRKLSKLLTELPAYYIQKDKTECPHTLKKQVLKELTTHTQDLTTETIDGVKIWFPNSSSILIRPSGTEPIYRLYAEGKTRDEAVQLVTEYKAKLQEIVARVTGD